eukprot:g348.t1
MFEAGAAAVGGVGQGIIVRKAAKDAVNQINQGAARAADIHSRILAAAFERAVHEEVISFNDNNRIIAERFTQLLLREIKESTQSALSTLRQAELEWRGLVEATLTRYYERLNKMSMMISFSLIVGLAMLGAILRIDVAMATLTFWHFWTFEFISKLVVTVAACVWCYLWGKQAVHAVILFDFRTRVLLENMSAEKEKTTTPEAGTTVKTTVYRSTVRTEVKSHSPGRFLIAEFPVTKQLQHSHLVITGALAAHAPHLGNAVQRWKFGDHQHEIEAQNVTYTGQQHGCTIPTVAVIDTELSGRHMLRLFYTSHSTGRCDPFPVLNPNTTDYPAYMDVRIYERASSSDEVFRGVVNHTTCAGTCSGIM